VLGYLYAEPKTWPPPAAKAISDAERGQHAEEARWFARMVAGAEVRFVSFTHSKLLAAFSELCFRHHPSSRC